MQAKTAPLKIYIPRILSIAGVVVSSLIYLSRGYGLPKNQDNKPPPEFTSTPTQQNITPVPLPMFFPFKTVDPSVSFGKILEEAAKSVFFTICLNKKDKPVLSGSSFKISDTEIMTALHVVLPDDCEYIRYYDAQENLIAVGASEFHYYQDNMNKKLDVITIKLGASGKAWKSIKALKFAQDKKLEIGQRVATIGYPAGFGFNVQMVMGEVSAKNMSNTCLGCVFSWKGGFSFTALSGPGNSGGPILNTAGEVVGVLVGKNEFTGSVLGMPIP